MEVRRAAHTPRDARIIERFLGAEQEAFTSSSTGDSFCRVSRLEPIHGRSFRSFVLSLSLSLSLSLWKFFSLCSRVAKNVEGRETVRNEDFCHFPGR